MEYDVKNKMRALGAMAVLIVVIMCLFFVFYQQKEKKNVAMKLRLFYSDLSQTLQYSMNINGTPESWGWHEGYKNTDVIMNNIVNYLRISENCIKKAGSCFADKPYKNLNNKYTNVNLFALPSVKLQNGISIAFETISSCNKNFQPCAIVYADINAIEPPNTFGKDLFVFLIINTQGTSFIPYGADMPAAELLSDEKFGCNIKSEIPMYCSGLLFGNNWVIDSKYPW